LYLVRYSQWQAWIVSGSVDNQPDIVPDHGVDQIADVLGRWLNTGFGFDITDGLQPKTL
jgi:hypothetical protein